MSRLPQPGGDGGNWGDILNDYLSQSHKSDGTLKDNSVGTSQLQSDAVTSAKIANDTVQEAQLSSAVVAKLNAPATVADASITKAKLATNVQASLDKADSALQAAPVTSVNAKTGDVSLTKSDIGLGAVNNTSDANKPISAAMQTALDAKYTKAAGGIPLTDLKQVDLDARYALDFPDITNTAPNPSLTNYPSGRALCGVFDSGRIFTISSFGLSMSLDNGATNLNKTLPADCGQSASAMGAAWIIEFKGKAYLSAKNASGVPCIWQSNPVTTAGGDFSWTKVFQTQADSGALPITCGLACDNSYIYWGDYGDPLASGSPGPRVYRSVDGTTWTSVLGPGSFAARHVHGIFPDPYNTGHVWMTCGDMGSAGYVYQSTDYGATWANVISTQAWQTVQLSFTPTHIYAGADVGGASLVAWRMDRSERVPRWIARTHHRQMAVPGSAPSRRVTDLVTTAGSTTVTSSSANFSAADVGSRIRTKGISFLPTICYVASITNTTTAVMKQSATYSGSSITAVIEGESWGVASYYGAVDPATGIYYYVSINGSFGGNVDGLFVIYPTGEIALIELLPTSPDCQVVIRNGRVYVSTVNRPLLTV